MPRQMRHAGRRTEWLLTCAATISCCRPASSRFPSATVSAQIGDIVKIIWSVDRHDIGKRLVTASPDLHQPHNPSHASTPGQTTDAKIPLWPSHPPNLRRSLLVARRHGPPLFQARPKALDVVAVVVDRRWAGDQEAGPPRAGSARPAHHGVAGRQSAVASTRQATSRSSVSGSSTCPVRRRRRWALPHAIQAINSNSTPPEPPPPRRSW